MFLFSVAPAGAIWVRDWLTMDIFLGLGILFLVGGSLSDSRVPAAVPPGHDDRNTPP